MKARLACQDEGVTSPPSSVKAVTRALVEKLSSLESMEQIEVELSSTQPLVAKYARASTGEVLAEIRGSEDI